MENRNALGRYLKRHGLSCAEFAREIATSPSQISRIVAGKRGPSVSLAFTIERATKGAIPASVWTAPRRSRAA
jgi:transcriptional regulator with XRE-family HTH domain